MQRFETDTLKGTEHTIDRLKKLKEEWLLAIEGTVIEKAEVASFFEDVLFDVTRKNQELYKESPEYQQDLRMNAEDQDFLRREYERQRL